MFKKILVVCVGNICRSPTAEIVLRHRLADRDGIEVSSAGLQALVGKPIDTTAADLLREASLPPDGHRARQIDDALLGRSDLILVMEHKHQAQIVKRAPQVSGKTFLLGKWRGNCEIPDPYRQQRPAFEHVYRLIDDCVAGWTPYIK